MTMKYKKAEFKKQLEILDKLQKMYSGIKKISQTPTYKVIEGENSTAKVNFGPIQYQRGLIKT